ncbi:hypothetical protein TFKS16_0504 [Tannerella forsythia KS16]|nr:hypothetical protein TF3313_0373 [Tannerella forsythia 3313]BAR50815.1 hypothetical protein TFKS16_0504 [Tannerella forsythia KS16]
MPLASNNEARLIKSRLFCITNYNLKFDEYFLQR